MKAHGGPDAQSFVFFISALAGRLQIEFIWLVTVTSGDLVNTVMNICVPQNEGDFLIS
jgi:hypothetical protein